MKSRRFQKYLQAKAAKKAMPLQQNEITHNNVSNETTGTAEEMKPKTKATKKAAAPGTKKDEKKTKPSAGKKGKPKK